MLDERMMYLAALLNIWGAASYTLATLRGRTAPSRVSWLLWGVIALIAFAAQLAEGVGLSALMTFMAGLGPLMVFLASFVNPQSVWRITRLDLTCGGLACAAICAWQSTRDANVAILLSILADGLAAMPTLVKAIKAPETEHPLPYLTAACSATITLLTIRHWTFAFYAFPAYILVFDLIIYLIIRCRTVSISTQL